MEGTKFLTMNYDSNFIKEWKEILRERYKDLSFDFQYIGINADGSVTPYSIFPNVFNKAQYGIVFAHYQYLRISNYDNSFFTLFITEDTANSFLHENGWNLSLDSPHTSIYKTLGRTCIIWNNELEIRIYFDGFSILTHIGDCFKLFKEAQKCSTQEELKYLKDIYYKTREIASLNKELFEKQAEIYYKEQAIEGYKDLLNQIRDLVGQKQQ